MVDELGDPDAVLILDDTGDLKKRSSSVGTQRQYTGTAGRIERSHVAVFLAYASRHGYTLIDREVYLPRTWTDDPARCAAAGVPDHVRFATKIALARRMLTRSTTAGVPAAWATADEFYGGDRDGELAFYRCWSPVQVTLPTLVREDARADLMRCRHTVSTLLLRH